MGAGGRGFESLCPDQNKINNLVDQQRSASAPSCTRHAHSTQPLDSRCWSKGSPIPYLDQKVVAALAMPSRARPGDGAVWGPALGLNSGGCVGRICHRPTKYPELKARVGGDRQVSTCAQRWCRPLRLASSALLVTIALGTRLPLQPTRIFNKRPQCVDAVPSQIGRAHV